jgi:4'-phosphopantetheinyl transferase
VTPMPHLDRAPSPDDFTQACMHTFARCSFTAPGTGEACVLLCDSTEWAAHAASAEGLLDIDERARAMRFHFEHDRLTYVTSHALWRMALGFCLGVDAALVRLSTTAAGQPRLPGTGYATSLSHSGRWIAIAICAAATVGVDIECSPSRTALDVLMPLICTPAEMADMEGLPAQTRETALLKLWTRKEALLKAFGVGLTADPAQLSAMSGELVMPPLSVTDQVPCRVCHIESFPNDLVGALAVPAGVSATRMYRLEKSP